MVRVFLLVGSTLNAFQQRVVGHLCDATDVDLVGACINGRRGVGPLAKVVRELRRGRGGYIGVQIISRLLARSGDRATTSADFLASRSIDAFVCEGLYAPNSVERIRDTRPDVLFQSGFGIIREPILSLAPHGVLSYHHGDLRKYRGQPVAFWELYHGEQEMGVTVQRLSARLDAGTILEELAVPIYPDDTWGKLQQRAYSVSDRLALCAVRATQLPNPRHEVVPPHALGTLYTTPNLRQWLLLHARIAARILRVRVLGGAERCGREDRAKGRVSDRSL